MMYTFLGRYTYIYIQYIYTHCLYTEPTRRMFVYIHIHIRTYTRHVYKHATQPPSDENKQPKQTYIYTAVFTSRRARWTRWPRRPPSPPPPTTRSSTRWRRVASWRPRRWLRRRRRGRGRPARRRGRSRSRPTRTACPVRQTPSRRAPRYRTLAGWRVIVKSTVKQTARAV